MGRSRHLWKLLSVARHATPNPVLENTLLFRGVALQLMSGPLIRLADMWAGCIRNAAMGLTEGLQLLRRAEEMNYTPKITP